MAKPNEFLDFIRSDGRVFPLQSPPSRLVLSNTGWGKPGENFSTSVGAYQHGSSPISYRLNPRTIQVAVSHRFKSRAAYWSGRSELLSQMGLNNANPNTPIEGVLRRKYYEDDLVKTRCLDVFLRNGLVYERPEAYQEFSIVENLEFVANNPIVYDPSAKTGTISTFTSSLVLPAPFPIVLGAYYGTRTITYIGTWESYPTITVVGPATDFYIQNLTTGAEIRLNYAISAGETVTFDLSYDKKLVYNNFGISLMPYIIESDLDQFAILPSIQVTGGTNNFYVTLDGYAGSTLITLTYYNRYYGV
jgi:hypothetical protein